LIVKIGAALWVIRFLLFDGAGIGDKDGSCGDGF
jgi:hypothetical protein